MGTWYVLFEAGAETAAEEAALAAGLVLGAAELALDAGDLQPNIARM